MRGEGATVPVAVQGHDLRMTDVPSGTAVKGSKFGPAGTQWVHSCVRQQT